VANSLFIQQLTAIVGNSNVLVETNSKKPFEHEWRGKFSAVALAVVFPNTVTQIQQIIKLCNSFKIHIVPQGGNTSLCAAAIPEVLNNNQEIILNLSKLNKIIKLDSLNQTLVVEAGCTLLQIQNFAKENNLYFPLSIGSEGSCQIGGNIATNAGGIHVLKYGMMRQLVMGLEVVLADGSVVQQLHELYKNNTYLDLKQVFVGSEGTLGIITKAVLKLYPQPNNYACGLIASNSINESIKIYKLLAQKYDLHAFEIINKYTQELYNEAFSNNKFPLSAEWLVLFEIIINDNYSLDSFSQDLTQFNIDLESVILASSEKERKNFWLQRENIPLAEKEHKLIIKHDISLPIGNIEQFLKLNFHHLQQSNYNFNLIIFGHLGDGNLHYNIHLNAADNYAQASQAINEIIYQDLNSLHGSFSAEHGIGQIKKDLYKKYADPVSYNLARAIKSLLDPNKLFNPGKIFY